MRSLVCLLGLLGVLAGPARADGLIGTWLTPPDAKAQTGHVVIEPCGAALCGTVTKAFDKTGKPIVTPSVGRRILWDLVGNATSASGKVYVPIMNSQFPVQIKVSGNRLDLKACNSLKICQTQVWQRVR